MFHCVRNPRWKWEKKSFSPDYPSLPSGQGGCGAEWFVVEDGIFFFGGCSSRKTGFSFLPFFSIRPWLFLKRPRSLHHLRTPERMLIHHLLWYWTLNPPSPLHIHPDIPVLWIHIQPAINLQRKRMTLKRLKGLIQRTGLTLFSPSTLDTDNSRKSNFLSFSLSLVVHVIIESYWTVGNCFLFFVYPTKAVRPGVVYRSSFFRGFSRGNSSLRLVNQGQCFFSLFFFKSP